MAGTLAAPQWLLTCWPNESESGRRKRQYMNRYVLDSFALLAFIQHEPGAEAVKAVIEQADIGRSEAYLSLVNLGEALYQFERRKGSELIPEFLALLDSLPITMVDVNFDRVIEAAHLKATYPFSYADAFVAALAHELDAVILTGDPEFRELGDAVHVQWLEQARKR